MPEGGKIKGTKDSEQINQIAENPQYIKWDIEHPTDI